MEHPTQETKTDGPLQQTRYAVKAGNQTHEIGGRIEAVKLAKRLSYSYWGSVSVRNHDKTVEMQYRRGFLVQYTNRPGGRKPR